MKLEYFEEKEFRKWWPKMSPKLLVKLDLLRFRWGKPINISVKKGAIGRDGKGTSQHFWEQFGEVRAVDTIPEGIETQEDAYKFFKLAIECGFTGIGFYPTWSKGPGFHLDSREDVKMGSPKKWGGLYHGDGTLFFVTITKAILKLPMRWKA